MPLQSPLFRGDPAFEKCLVDDRAHILEGAQGAHVTKIHRALMTLDDARIDPREVKDRRYGKSTAAAVLEFKKKRNVINRSYQSAADNIVGKMTIATLDSEMAAFSQGPPLRVCREPAASPAVSVERARRLSALRDGDEPPPPNGRKTSLRIVIQHAQLPPRGVLSGFTLSMEMAVGRFLRQHDMSLNVIGRNDFNFDSPITSNDASDVVGLRKAAGNAMPDAAVGNALRVIFCPFGPREEFTGSSYGETTLPQVPNVRNFVVINALRRNPDGLTILHEMIHCSDPRFMGDVDDEDPTSVFCRKSSSRTVLRPVHIASLRRAFFATPA